MLAAALGAAVVGSAAPLFLSCVGWSRDLGGTIAHTVAISPPKAAVEGIPYTVEVSQTGYVLTRQSKTVREMLEAGGLKMDINRVTGAYVLMNAANKVLDWSRPQDPGCVKMARKF